MIQFTDFYKIATLAFKGTKSNFNSDTHENML